MSNVPRLPSPVHVRYLYGADVYQFSQTVKFGKNAQSDLKVEMKPLELLQAAKWLTDESELPDYAALVEIKRGRGVQVVQFRIPRKLILDLAATLGGSKDLKDAGHRFWHWESKTPSPCSTCEETLDAEDEKVDRARSLLISEWSVKLGISAGQIEAFLTEYHALPRKLYRDRR